MGITWININTNLNINTNINSGSEKEMQDVLSVDDIGKMGTRRGSWTSVGSRGVKRVRAENGEVVEDLDLEIRLTLKKELESFLFNDSNKINKAAIKFIMSKWNDLEHRLHIAEVQNYKLRGRLEEKDRAEEKNKQERRKILLMSLSQQLNS